MPKMLLFTSVQLWPLAWFKLQHLLPRFLQEPSYSPLSLAPEICSPCCSQSNLEAQVYLFHTQPSQHTHLKAAQIPLGFPIALRKSSGVLCATPLALCSSHTGSFPGPQMLHPPCSHRAFAHNFLSSLPTLPSWYLPFLKSQFKYSFFKGI